MRRAVGVVTALVLAGAASYAAADVLDVAPGVLTRDAPVAPPPVPGSTATPSWLPLPSPAVARITHPQAPAPTKDALAARLDPLLKDPALGRSVGASARDGVSGAVLYARSATRARTPASTAKLLSALAVTTALDPTGRMTTRAVAGEKGEVVLVAGGDTMLAEGGGRRGVEGRAGLADLADQTAEALTARGVKKVSLRLDLGYAAGPRYPAGWNPADVAAGFTQGVAMVGLAGQRPEPGKPSPRVPEVEVAERFADLLAERGHPTSTTPRSTWSKPAPRGATVLGQVRSAPYRDVLALALADSDNALTENLVRQAMAAQGLPTAKQGAPAAFVTETLRAAGVDTTGMVLKDASGLAAGQRVSAATLSAVLALAVSGGPDGFRAAVADLPVAGLTGSLADRFDGPVTVEVAGIPRAKTGTLTGVSALAGSTVDADGYPLTYVVIADEVPASGTGTLGARAALDRFVTGLTTCGCR